MTNKRVFLLVAVTVLSWGFYHQSSAAKIDYLIQPWSAIEQNSSLRDSGLYTMSLHRAQAGLKVDRAAGPLQLTGRLSVDFANGSYKNLLENAYVKASLAPLANVKVGKFKVPFGADHLISSSLMPTIYRSFTTDNLNNELKVSEYRTGVLWYGNVQQYLDFEAGLFEFNDSLKGFAQGGVSTWPIASLPVMHLTAYPLKHVTFQYMVAAPGYAAVRDLGRTNVLDRKRVILHDFALKVSTPHRYEGFLECFVGPDTSDVRDLNRIVKDYQNNVEFSIYTYHTFKFSLPHEMELRWTTGAEFLNGLNYYYYRYVDRPFYYGVTESAQLTFAKDVSVDLALDRRFDANFQRIPFDRAAVQLTWCGSVKLDKGKGKAAPQTDDNDIEN